MTTWYTADQHLGHERIIALCDRPFRTVAEMDAALIDRWNSRVDPDDTVWVLGDVAMGDLDASLSLISRLHGRKYLAAGNHDRCFEGYNDNATRPARLDRWRRRYLDAGFAGIVDGSAVRRTGALVTLPLRDRLGNRVTTIGVNHFPDAGESNSDRPDRYAEYRPRAVSRRLLPATVPATPPAYDWLVHGHVHGAWRTRGRRINVGVDVWDFAPVPEDALLELIARGADDEPRFD